MKKYIFLISIITLFLSYKINAVEAGKWSFFADDNFCYIGSAPIKVEITEGKKRGDTYTLVYRINKSPEKIVQITAGYTYDESKPVIVKIDQTSFKFFSKEDSAWTKEEDKKVILSMQKGIKMIIQGYSSLLSLFSIFSSIASTYSF